MNQLFYRSVLVFFLMIVFFPVAGQDTVKTNGFQQFFYPNGKLSSEGNMQDGKPNGYWKSYYENGHLKSEGNRKNFDVDSIWKFYNEEGKLILEINYSKGKKNGLKISYLEKETIKENFKNDIKEGMTYYTYPDGKIKLEIPFIKGLEQGFGKEYASDGTIITLTEYKRGFIVDRQRINRRDKNNLKQGRWYDFYENGNIRMEGTYRDDKMHGYFKEYNENGDFLRINKYEHGVLLKDAEEIQKLEVRNEYYPDGKLKISAMFRNDIPEGIRREYNPEGRIEKAYLYKNGILSGEGIILEDGNKDGAWKEYYSDGKIKAEGNYENGKQTGEWKYYFETGRLEQIGRFNKQGNPDGRWKWFFENGQLLREENYHGGVRDGMLTEYDETGKMITEGEYVNGLEEGLWFEITGDYLSRGSYRDGMRNGSWSGWYLFRNGQKTDSVLSFTGNYIEDYPDGKHVYYWDNGKIRDEGLFVMGRKEGEWIKNEYDGSLFMVITYKNGVEVRYDGVKIKPPFEKEE